MKRKPLTFGAALQFGLKAAADKITEGARVGRMVTKEEVGIHVGKVLLATAAEAISSDEVGEEKVPDTERTPIETEGKEVL